MQSNIQYITAKAADSVGVKIPVQIEPRMSIGANKIKRLFFVRLNLFFKVKRSFLIYFGSPLHLKKTYTIKQLR